MMPSFHKDAANSESSGLNEGAMASRPNGLANARSSCPVSRSQTLA
jgi:hypothetical protein